MKSVIRERKNRNVRSSVKIVRLRSAILTEKTRAADVLVFQLVIHIHMTAKKKPAFTISRMPIVFTGQSLP